MPSPNGLLPGSTDEPIGTRLIDSTPAAMTMSYAPASTPWAAKLIACWLLPHWRSTVVPGTLSGNPAPSSALRAMLTAWSPTWVTAPAMTSSTCAGIHAGALHQLAQAVRQQIGRQYVVQCSAGLALADRGAYRSDDDGVTP